jgi:hypothetical protein
MKTGNQNPRTSGRGAVKADVPSIAAAWEAGLKLSGNFCEVGVKAEVAVGFSACRYGQNESIRVTS